MLIRLAPLCCLASRGRYVVSSGAGEHRISYTSASLPDGVVLKACGSRSEVRCPACAQVYRGDARHLVRSGLEGGKGVPEAVAEHPAIFLTLTAPSFGLVHTVRPPGDCREGHGRRRCIHDCSKVCTQRHGSNDGLIGTPLCPECYDYPNAVLHNACTSELWRRTMIYAARHLGSALGVSQAEAKKLTRLSFCRVAEFQRRTNVHLHAIVRADGPEGSLPSFGADQLTAACLVAARAVSVPHARGAARWGNEIDVQQLGNDGERAAKVASYVAKYATKSSSEDPRLDPRIASLEDLNARGLPANMHGMVATALELDADPVLGNLNLGRPLMADDRAEPTGAEHYQRLRVLAPAPGAAVPRRAPAADAAADRHGGVAGLPAAAGYSNSTIHTAAPSSEWC